MLKEDPRINPLHKYQEIIGFSFYFSDFNLLGTYNG